MGARTAMPVTGCPARSSIAWSALAAKAQGRGEDNSRAVRIIEAPPGQTAAPPPQPLPRRRGDVDIRRISIKVAELGRGRARDPARRGTFDRHPGDASASRRKQPGYLILVDVDPTGKLTQIYPNRHSLQMRESRESLNLIKPGQAITIPSRDDPFAGLRVCGLAARRRRDARRDPERPARSIWSICRTSRPRNADKRAFDQLMEVARQLRIAREDEPELAEEPKWSFDAKLYVVK